MVWTLGTYRCCWLGQVLYDDECGWTRHMEPLMNTWSDDIKDSVKSFDLFCLHLHTFRKPPHKIKINCYIKWLKIFYSSEISTVLIDWWILKILRLHPNIFWNVNHSLVTAHSCLTSHAACGTVLTLKTSKYLGRMQFTDNVYEVVLDVITQQFWHEITRPRHWRVIHNIPSTNNMCVRALQICASSSSSSSSV